VYHKTARFATECSVILPLEKFNSQMQQLFTFIFVHFITPQ